MLLQLFQKYAYSFSLVLVLSFSLILFTYKFIGNIH